MISEQTAGIIIIAGVALWIAAMLGAPPGVYNMEDIAARMTILDAYPTRWIISQVLFALGALVPTIGLGLLVLALRGDPGGWLPLAGAAVFALGGLIGAVVVVQQTLDPVGFWEGTAAALTGTTYIWLVLAGLAAIGVYLVQASFPNWLGYVSMGTAVAGAGVLIVTGGGTGFFVASFVYLVTLMAGIVAL